MARCSAGSAERRHRRSASTRSSRLINNLVGLRSRLGLSELIAIPMLIGVMLLLIWRIRWRLRNTPALVDTHCPRCGSELQRVHRHSIDRAISIFVPVRRYRCANRECGWSGGASPRAVAEAAPSRRRNRGGWMELARLLLSLPNLIAATGTDRVQISHITADSRQVSPGALFVAYRGVGVDGHRYIGDAARTRGRGNRRRAAARCPPRATAGVHPGGGWPGGARLAERGLARPPQPRDGAGRHHRHRWQDDHGESALQHAGRGRQTCRADQHRQRRHRRPEPTRPGCTPPPPMPPTSSATWPRCATPAPRSRCWRRLRTVWRSIASPAVPFDIAVVTNITHEHLDFHGTYEAYRDAKALLFRSLSASYRKPGLIKTAVLNRDDSSFDFLAALPAERRIVYGVGEDESGREGDTTVDRACYSTSPRRYRI